MLTNKTQEIAAVAVSPVEHRGYAELSIESYFRHLGDGYRQLFGRAGIIDDWCF
jgi:hypothetical protein